MEAFNRITVPSSSLQVSFPYLCQSYAQRLIPDPRKVFGMILEQGGPISHWTFTDPHRGNRWRELAHGHRVLAFPIWLYCDDTSGNSSKRWNKHNSFLFTAAGLTHDQVHLDYNVHFICTSNIASPLEMLEGIVDELNTGQQLGLWAWDCVFQDAVLLIPSVFALLGDNPMQSELSSHVGLMGNQPCRICNVVSRETATDDQTAATSNQGAAVSNDLENDGNTSDVSVHTSSPGSSHSNLPGGAQVNRTQIRKEQRAGKPKPLWLNMWNLQEDLFILVHSKINPQHNRIFLKFTMHFAH